MINGRIYSLINVSLVTGIPNGGHGGDEVRIFFNGVPDHYHVGPGVIGPFDKQSSGDAATDDQGQPDGILYTAYHGGGYRFLGAAAGIHIDKFHAEHLSGRGGAYGNIVF